MHRPDYRPDYPFMGRIHPCGSVLMSLFWLNDAACWRWSRWNSNGQRTSERADRPEQSGVRSSPVGGKGRILSVGRPRVWAEFMSHGWRLRQCAVRWARLPHAARCWRTQRRWYGITSSSYRYVSRARSQRQTCPAMGIAPWRVRKPFKNVVACSIVNQCKPFMYSSFFKPNPPSELKLTALVWSTELHRMTQQCHIPFLCMLCFLMWFCKDS